MTFEVQFDLDDKSLVLHDTSAAAAEAAAERAEAAAAILEDVQLRAAGDGTVTLSIGGQT
jgi:multidrug resistance efflux pump